MRNIPIYSPEVLGRMQEISTKMIAAREDLMRLQGEYEALATGQNATIASAAPAVTAPPATQAGFQPSLTTVSGASVFPAAKKERSISFPELNAGKKLDDAMYEVLRQANSPLHSAEIGQALVGAGYRFPEGSDPHKFIQLRIYQSKTVVKVPEQSDLFMAAAALPAPARKGRPPVYEAAAEQQRQAAAAEQKRQAILKLKKSRP